MSKLFYKGNILKKIDRLHARIQANKTIMFYEALWVEWAESRVQSSMFDYLTELAKKNKVHKLRLTQPIWKKIISGLIEMV